MSSTTRDRQPQKSSSPESRVRVRSLSKEFRSHDGTIVQALENIDLEIRGGEFLSLIGASGCGKSTLLRLIAGLDAASSGELLFDGAPIRGPDRLRGLVFQDPNLFPWLTVQGNIAFGPNSERNLPLSRAERKHKAGKVSDFVRLVGLNDFAKAFPHQLSGGMAQRAALARALINEPEVLLLDEPLGALDDFTRMRMQDELLRIWQNLRPTIVMVTHDIDEAVYLSDRIVIFSPRPGRIVNIVDIPLARPRNRTDPELLRIRGKILEHFEFAWSKNAEEDYEI